MSLVRMAFARYRCFRERQEVELRPLTVVLGKNNEGKSALVRLPYVLSTGMETSSPAPLELERLDPDMVESFTDLVYANRPHGSIGIEFEMADAEVGQCRFAATVQNLDEYRAQVVSSVEFGDRHNLVRLRWMTDSPADAGRYDLEMDLAATRHEASNVLIPFTGLVPSSNTLYPMLSGAEPKQCLRSLYDVLSRYPTVRYFGPFREPAHRRYRLPTRAPASIGLRGQDAAGVLASDLARNRGRIGKRLNEALESFLPDWGVEVVEQGGLYSVLLSSRTDSEVRVNLADTGAGVAQALPLFVQRAMDLVDSPKGSILEIIEQPELHLHPAAHGALADLYIDAVHATGVRFLVETHSETFLLRLRRRIAQGELDPAMLAVYFVEKRDGTASVQPVNVDADGNLDYWPEGVFSEDYAEVRALAKAQMAKAENDAG